MKILSTRFFCLLVWAGFASVAHAEVRVFATLPEWGALAQEIGGKQVTVTVATTALQDPHRIQARPSLIAAARRADLLIATGAGLEIGWMPAVISAAGNEKIQLGQMGYLEASSLVKLLDVPSHVDRSMGDVHPEGNPHLQLDPANILLVGEGLKTRLKQIDAAHSAEYEKNWQDFSARWREAIIGWKRRAAPLHGVMVMDQHKGFSYLYAWTGLNEVATLEPLPGVPPTASHLATLVDLAGKEPVKMIILAAYQPRTEAQWLHDKTNVPIVVLPFTVGGSDKAKDLFSLFEDTLQQLLTAAGK